MQEILAALKILQAFTYVWENHREDADWFIKTDDDTFVIMENLKYQFKFKLDQVHFACKTHLGEPSKVKNWRNVEKLHIFLTPPPGIESMDFP